MKENFRIINACYTASAVRLDQYPEGDFSEIAFIGRSNVGKSSLINSLCRHRGLALVSGQPGKTQTINFFTVTSKVAEDHRISWFLVDLPGYGYAKRAKESKQQWAKFIDEYIQKSNRLKLVCHLIDCRHSLMESDREAYSWLIGRGVPIQVVATKTDKLSRAEAKKNIDSIAKELKPAADIIAYSALKGDGRNELLDVIGCILLK